MTSTQAVGRLKFLFNAKKAGHAGTLDPLASGVLPVAFGEATKTVPVVQDGAKSYRFRVRWGEESATDDAEGEIVARSDRGPPRPRLRACCHASSAPFSNAADLLGCPNRRRARLQPRARGQTFEIEPRPIHVYRLELMTAEANEAVLEAECGKGAYVRAIARDLGRALGCYGHVANAADSASGRFWPTQAFRSIACRTTRI